MNKSRCFLVDMYLCGHQLVGYIIYINIKSNNSTCPFLGGVLLTVIIHDRKSDWYQYCPVWSTRFSHRVELCHQSTHRRFVSAFARALTAVSYYLAGQVVHHQ